MALIHGKEFDLMTVSDLNDAGLVKQAKKLLQLYVSNLQTLVTKVSDELANLGDLGASLYLTNAIHELGLTLGYKYSSECSKQLVIFRQHLWERLHSVHWSQTPVIYRELYAYITHFLVAVCIIHQPKFDVQFLQKTLDLGLLLGAGSARTGLNELINLLTAHKTCDVSQPRVKPPSADRCSFPLPVSVPHKAKAIPIHHNISIIDFYEQFFLPQTPAVLTGMIDDWPALSSTDRSWQDINYLLAVCGHRTVPIETGSSYMSDQAGTSLISISEFIHQHILSPTEDISSRPQGYLAQHELFEQIPLLKQDIMTPDLCSLTKDDDEEPSELVIQAWFGPHGTVSPLHYDSSYNLLVQVAGYKYVRLYHEKESDKLYRLQADRMKNNSQVDLLSSFEELQRSFPLVLEAEYSEVILGPGDMFFIPRWHWHFITAVDHNTAARWEQERLVSADTARIRPYADTYCQHSFSVSFWWNRKEK